MLAHTSLSPAARRAVSDMLCGGAGGPVVRDGRWFDTPSGGERRSTGVVVAGGLGAPERPPLAARLSLPRPSRSRRCRSWSLWLAIGAISSYFAGVSGGSYLICSTAADSISVLYVELPLLSSPCTEYPTKERLYAIDAEILTSPHASSENQS